MLVIGIGARYGEEMTSSPPPAPGPLCVQCGRTVKSLYKEYSKDNIRLTRCVSHSRVRSLNADCFLTLAFSSP